MLQLVTLSSSVFSPIAVYFFFSFFFELALGILLALKNILITFHNFFYFYDVLKNLFI